MESMTTALAATHPQNDYAPIVAMVCDAVTSEHTRRAYARALTDFVGWFQESGHSGLSKAAVNAHVTALRAGGTSASSINQRLTAIRKLASEAADNGLIDYATAQAIAKAEGVRSAGKRLGNWLSKQDAQALLDTPSEVTTKGIRDRAILAVLLGCGLRREECARLRVEHIQQREGRWVLVDLIGKRNKMRSVPMPSFAKAAVDSWCKVAGITSGALFLSIRKGGNIQREGMSSQAIRDAVAECSEGLGLTNVAPHDLRRSFAKLAHKGGSTIDQIQLSLGHSSIQTTERYLGVTQNLHSAPCDNLGLK